MLLCVAVDDRHELLDFLIIQGDLHALASENIGRAHEYRISELIRDFLCLLGSEDRRPGRTFDAAFLQYLVKNLAVLGCIDILRIGAEDRHTHLGEVRSQLDGCLSAELHNRVIRMLDVHDVLHVLRSERLKIKLVRDVKIRGDRLGVIVDDDRLVSSLRECPRRVHGAVVEFDSLTDADGAGTENQNLLPVRDFFLCLVLDFILIAVNRVIIRSFGFELGGAGVNHLVLCGDAVLLSEAADRRLLKTGEAGNNIVREFALLCLEKNAPPEEFVHLALTLSIDAGLPDLAADSLQF